MAGILSPTLIMVRPEGGVGFLAKLGLNTPGGALQLRDSDAGRFLGAALRGRRAHGTYGAHGWPARRAQPHLDGLDDARPLHPARVASGKLWSPAGNAQAACTHFYRSVVNRLGRRTWLNTKVDSENKLASLERIAACVQRIAPRVTICK